MTQSIHDIPTLINQYIATTTDEVTTNNPYISELVTLITTDELTLLQFVSSLGKSLTSDMDLIRSKSMSCLSQVLAGLPPSKLTRQDVGVLVDFVLVKLDDKLSLPFVLQGLNSLVQMNQFNHGTKVLNGLISGYSPKQNLAKVRYETFLILQSLIDRIGPAHHDLFVKTFIHIAQGEKDPRNLINSFALNTKINQKFTFDIDNPLHQQLIDDLFDVCFCYFPITFTPPANDPYKITSSDLKQALSNTIASQSLFAGESITNLIEKLTSTNPIIRCDVLTTLNLCITNYTLETIQQHWVTIWNAVKFEVLHNSNSLPVGSLIPQDYQAIDDNDDIKPVVLTLVIIKNLVNKLSSSDLEMVLHELTPNLVNVTNKSKLSMIILCVCAEVSLEKFNYVVDQVFSYSIWGKYFNVENDQESEEPNTDLSLNIEQQGQLVDNLEYIFLAYHTLSPKESNLSSYKDHILIFLIHLLNSNVDTSLPKKVILQLINLIKMGNFLTLQDLELILTNFQTILLETDSPELTDSCISGLVSTLSEPRITQLVIELIVTPIINQIETDMTKLETITKLCINYPILEVISIKLLARIGTITNSTDEDKMNQVTIITNTLVKLINQVTGQVQFLTDSWYVHFLPTFLTNLFKLVPVTTSDYTLIESSSSLIGLIIRYIDVKKHQRILNDMIEMFTSEDTSKFSGNLTSGASGYIVLFNKIIASIDRTCEFEKVDTVLNKMIELVKSVDEEYIRIHYLQGISLLVNKFSTTTCFIDMTNPVDFEIYIWILKGLLVKLDPAGTTQLTELVQQFTTGTTTIPSSTIAKSFRVLFIDIDIFTSTTPKHISKVRNLNVRPLYKQRIFQIIVPDLLLPHITNPDCLLALALIIENTSTTILTQYLSVLSTVIMACMKHLTNSIILKSGLSMINVVLNQDDTILDEYVPELVPILLRVATTKIGDKKRVNDESCRVLALLNLTILFNKGHYGDKSQTLNQLRGCLDDKKRRVRKLAIDLIQLLYELK
ncbi:DNA repair/transcription protein MET18/MMS19 [Spathaspora sp. JA1]|nr:DNA repair/transcription protein MET18/MMS19 [Spathaspora sp. JA1]